MGRNLITCEAYVLEKLAEKERECEELKGEVESLRQRLFEIESDPTVELEVFKDETSEARS